MDRSTLTIIIAIAAVAILSLLMRRMARSGTEVVSMPRGVTGPPEDEAPEEAGESTAGPAPVHVPVSVAGMAFLPGAHGVVLLPLDDGAESRPDWLDRALESNYVPFTVLNQLYFPGAGGGIAGRQLGIELGAGDLTGARIVQGAAGSEAWRLETLGRDGDYGFHPFSTRKAAEEALEVLVGHEVVRGAVDDEGNPAPASPEDFEEARRRFEETASDLAIDAEGSEGPREGPWVSDRR